MTIIVFTRPELQQIHAAQRALAGGAISGVPETARTDGLYLEDALAMAFAGQLDAETHDDALAIAAEYVR